MNTKENTLYARTGNTNIEILKNCSFRKGKKNRIEEMVLLVKDLQSKQEAELEPQRPHKMVGVAVHSCIPSAGEAEMQRVKLMLATPLCGS